ncbi:MAG: response regulator [Desulfobacterales bacterium]|nr:response regulator [Desulfobacterales bacterium]
MSHIFIVTSEKNGLNDLISALTLKTDIKSVCVESGRQALEAAVKLSPDLVIIDEQLKDMSGLELVQRLISVNAFINTAVISSLSDEDFHEASEGLGVLMKLSPKPAKSDAAELLEKLESIS